jgi:hypothetical protein
MQFSRFEMREVMLLMPSYRAIKNTLCREPNIAYSCQSSFQLARTTTDKNNQNNSIQSNKN